MGGPYFVSDRTFHTIVSNPQLQIQKTRENRCSLGALCIAGDQSCSTRQEAAEALSEREVEVFHLSDERGSSSLCATAISSTSGTRYVLPCMSERVENLRLKRSTFLPCLLTLCNPYARR